MTINKKNLTPIALVSIFLLMLALSFAAVPLYDLFCRVTGFGGTTQNASDKEIPKIIVNQDYKIKFAWFCTLSLIVSSYLSPNFSVFIIYFFYFPKIKTQI